jgi:thiol-disulfide isomerase/thioredoxin
MIEIPTALAIAQWVVLFAFAVLLVVAFRQLAYLMEVGQAASAHGGLAAGTEAPPFHYQRIALGSDGARASFDPRGRPSLLMFTDPACGSCENALRTLERLARSRDEDGIRVLAMTSADEQVIEVISSFRDTTLELGRVDPSVERRLYESYATPFFYAIDADGIVRDAGAAESEEAIVALFGVLDHAHEHNHAHDHQVLVTATTEGR